jgi:hypothetical protein
MGWLCSPIKMVGAAHPADCMIKLSTKKLSILGIEIGLFGVILLTIWLDEFLDMPRILFNASPAPHRLEEYLIETGLICVVAAIVIVITFIGLKRIERFEHYLRVCAWCKNVWLDDKWVKFEQYMEAQHELRSTHGICDKCHEKLMSESKSDNQ